MRVLYTIMVIEPADHRLPEGGIIGLHRVVIGIDVAVFGGQVCVVPYAEHVLVKENPVMGRGPKFAVDDQITIRFVVHGLKDSAKQELNERDVSRMIRVRPFAEVIANRKKKVVICERL